MKRVLGSASPKLRSAAPAAAFALVYFLTATLTDQLIGDAGIAVLWPASGVYLGVMLLAPHRMWPLLAAGAAVGSLAAYAYGGSSFEVSLAFAVPSSAEGLLGALLVERIARRRFTLGGMHDLFALVLGGALVANGLVALSAGAVAAQTFDASFAESWLRWWSADALGILAVTPIITAPLREGRRGRARLWSPPRVVALAGLALGIVAMQLVSHGSDLVSGAGDVGDQVYMVQAFLAVLQVVSLALAVSLTERERLRSELGSAGAELGGSVERLDDARRRIAQLSAELAARRAELVQAERGGERAASELRESQAARGRAERELNDANSALRASRRERDDAKSALAASRRERDELARDLGLTTADRDRLQSELGASADAAKQMQADLNAAAEELSRTRADSRTLRESLERGRADRSALREELERASGEGHALGERLERVRSERDTLAAELDSARDGQAREARELAEALDGRRRAEEELAALAGRVEGLQRELELSRRAHRDAELALEHARARFNERRERLERSLGGPPSGLTAAPARAAELSSRYDERGLCLSATPGFARLLGYEPHELVGHAGADLLHPEDLPRLARARATRSPSSFEARLRRKAGGFVWVEVSLDPVWSSAYGRLVSLTTTVRELPAGRVAA